MRNYQHYRRFSRRTKSFSLRPRRSLARTDVRRLVWPGATIPTNRLGIGGPKLMSAMPGNGEIPFRAGNSGRSRRIQPALQLGPPRRPISLTYDSSMCSVADRPFAKTERDRFVSPIAEDVQMWTVLVLSTDCPGRLPTGRQAGPYWRCKGMPRTHIRQSKAHAQSRYVQDTGAILAIFWVEESRLSDTMVSCTNVLGPVSPVLSGRRRRLAGPVRERRRFYARVEASCSLARSLCLDGAVRRFLVCIVLRSVSRLMRVDCRCRRSGMI